MWKKIKVVSDALDAMYARLGYVRGWIWLSNLSLLVWYLTEAKKMQPSGVKLYDVVLRQISTFTTTRDDDSYELMGIDAPFREVAHYVLFILGSVFLAYLLQFVPPNYLRTWWACSILTLIPTGFLLWYLRVGVPTLYRNIPINNGAIIFVLMRKS